MSVGLQDICLMLDLVDNKANVHIQLLIPVHLKEDSNMLFQSLLLSVCIKVFEFLLLRRGLINKGYVSKTAAFVSPKDCPG